ncbi:5-methylcytosine-specific restriction protein B [Rhodococcus coprophilus]|uniref:5-methylcytosine-specific restriction protein B n=1 Tax=Rhodococcus coprophilus TaxID=38310 RepID=A0A2X4U446_9NOCA|nr:5-methylcytosine-specific restriction protein B [Rhodococcus coprophilus]
MPYGANVPKFWGTHNDQPSIDPVADGAVRLGWDELGDLALLHPTRDAFKEAVAGAFPDRPESVASWAGTLYRFVHALAVGDVVVCPDRATRTINIGRVRGGYEFHPEVEQYRHWRPIQWLVTGVPRDELSVSAQNQISAALSLFTLTTAGEEIARLIDEPHSATEQDDFLWVPFYQELADVILTFRNNREGLLDRLWNVAETPGLERYFRYLRTDVHKDGSRGAIRDIDPFTAFGPFNRGITDSTRARIAETYRIVFEITAAAPTSFVGIPVVSNLNSWFIRYENGRSPGEVDRLWDLAEATTAYAAVGNEDTRERLVAAFDAAARGNTRQLSMGIYWIRPETFAAYDQVNAGFLVGQYPEFAAILALRSKIDGEHFLANTEQIRSWIQDESTPFSSIPELSAAAWRYTKMKHEPSTEPSETALSAASDSEPIEGDIYTLDSIIEDGCFVPRSELETFQERLLSKKNLIFQGPPGTGKTWLARRLAWTICNERRSDRVTVLQFHPSLSYEDFVRGWRPATEGRLELADGPFLDLCRNADAHRDDNHVLVIEEINRGNPAQIFGELLTLLEADKRSPDNAMRLAYPIDEDERFHIPPNLYVIGTMNLADRSLALVDMALRRRFAFIELEPQFGSAWTEHVSGLGYDLETLERFGARMQELNTQIIEDRTLGRQFRIGHSFFTPGPSTGAVTLTTQQWLDRVVQTEIKPLLEEYWFDRPGTVDDALAKLREL